MESSRLKFEVVEVDASSGTVVLQPIGRLTYAGLPTVHGFHFHEGQVVEGPVIRASELGERRVRLPKV